MQKQTFHLIFRDAWLDGLNDCTVRVTIEISRRVNGYTRGWVNIPADFVGVSQDVQLFRSLNHSQLYDDGEKQCLVGLELFDTVELCWDGFIS